jgi:LmbE family N-acetylglucosaminyl deacetylase
LPKKERAIHIFAFFLFFFHSIDSSKGYDTDYSSNEILAALTKLKTLASVLYIAAHPDDENTAVLAYMSKGKLARTAYLSLTRGDGGQNLIGNEKGDLLGVIRTEELLSAREIDGAEQYFTRAIDFGYSKTTEETLNFWDKSVILGDIVKLIRQFRPDIMITRFSRTDGGHGHHLASAFLAEEAFKAAGDPNMFTEQLNELAVWQPMRLYWNTWRPSNEAINIDIGEYSTLYGKSFNEISAKSRSMHKSQGFGVSPTRGSQLVYFDYLAGEKAEMDLFEGVDVTWSRIDGGDKIESKINGIIEKYDERYPEKIVPDLVNLYRSTKSLKEKYWTELKRNEIKQLIKLCTGLWMESIVWDPEISPGSSIDVRTMILNRSNAEVYLESISTVYSKNIFNETKILEYNSPLNYKENISIPLNADYSQPFWLREEHDGMMFSIDNENIGLPKEKAQIFTDFILNISGEKFVYSIPTVYRRNDAVEGEVLKPLVIIPEISISADQNTLVFPNGKRHIVNINILSKIDGAEGKLLFELPIGWKTDKNSQKFSIPNKGGQQNFQFEIIPDQSAMSGKAMIRVEMNGKNFRHEIIEIDYPHIEYRTVLRQSDLNLVKLDIDIEPRKIGYIMGSGDKIPDALSQTGYEVDLLTDEYIDFGDLSVYDVIICGIRAFNVRENLARQQRRLIDFVNEGGTWIVQHNTRFGIQTEQIGPYPFSTNGRDRISEEDAELEILVPDHQIFNYPNKITQEDFENWVQERGLYFADSWEGKLYPLLAGSDTGEPSKLGGLLYSNYGKGVFIFTAYSWFRQLPAGVPGAYRLFTNIISAKGNK